MREINIPDSIRKKKLVLKELLFYSIFPSLIYGGAVGYMVLIFLIDLVTKRRYDPAQNQLILVLIILAALAYVGIKNSLNAFDCQVFRGKSKDDNIRLAHIVLQKYRKIDVIDNNDQFIRGSQRGGRFSWGKELFLIFDNDSVLINYSSLGLFDQAYRSHADRNFEKELITKFTLLAGDDNVHIDVGGATEGKLAPIKIFGLTVWSSERKSALIELTGLLAWSLVIIGLLSLISPVRLLRK